MSVHLYVWFLSDLCPSTTNFFESKYVTYKSCHSLCQDRDIKAIPNDSLSSKSVSKNVLAIARDLGNSVLITNSNIARIILIESILSGDLLYFDFIGWKNHCDVIIRRKIPRFPSRFDCEI